MSQEDLRQCRYCPQKILWGVTAERGNAVPLDPKPVKIWIHATEPGRVDPGEPRLRLVSGYVPHHATCAGVDEARADVEKKRAAQTQKNRRR